MPFLHPTPLQSVGVALGKAGSVVWRIVGTVAPVGVVLALAGHDFVIAGAYNLAGCRIKGNVSYNGGEKIFHVPGQSYYKGAKIELLRGEHWFCTEAEARAAGWRKSRT